METTELIDLLKGEKEFYEDLSDLAEVVLYGSAMSEEEIAGDIDLLLIPSREMSESEKVDLRQIVWEHLKDRVPVMLEVQTPKEGLTKEALSSNGVQMNSVFSR